MKRNHCDEKPFKCKVCDEQFTLYCDFESHVNSVHHKTNIKHKKISMNQCPECARTFLNLNRLNSHLITIHHDGKNCSFSASAS